MDIIASNRQPELALVNPHQISGTVTPATPETLGPRVLELTGLLQTTLEIEQQVELFAREVGSTVSIDGAIFKDAVEGVEVNVGDRATHRATYNLTLANQALGEMRIFRELPFTTREIASLENMLCALVYPMRNALTYRHAVRQALRDPLTGIQNRAALEQALIREVELSRRLNSPLSILVFDIDHFKKFNDTYGHSFGDDAIRAVACTAETTIRRSDLLFRYGGEEFVVLASHTSEAGAKLLAERIRANIEQLGTIGGRSTQVTVSVGVSTLKDQETTKVFFDRADSALYSAKSKGRNRVESE
jgi:diguanylate cyclase (GGDEF)-like protein